MNISSVLVSDRKVVSGKSSRSLFETVNTLGGIRTHINPLREGSFIHLSYEGV